MVWLNEGSCSDLCGLMLFLGMRVNTIWIVEGCYAINGTLYSLEAKEME